jgi:hypothetical protein
MDFPTWSQLCLKSFLVQAGFANSKKAGAVTEPDMLRHSRGLRKQSVTLRNSSHLRVHCLAFAQLPVDRGYFRVARNPSRVDAKREDQLLQADLNEAALRRMLRVRAGERCRCDRDIVKMMLEGLERRNYSEATTRCYIRTVEDFSRRFKRSPDCLGSRTHS